MMSWSLTAYGHALGKDQESKLVEALRAVFSDDAAGTLYASIGTQYGGQVDLQRPDDADAID